MEFDPLSNRVLGAALEVHRTLGPGLLESAYAQALAYELISNSLAVRTEVEVPIEYKGIKLGTGFRIDLLVEEKLVVELKSVEKLLPLHEAQLLTYLKLAHLKTGLKHGIKRFVL